MTDQGATYKAAGVDIEKGARVVERIKPHVGATRTPGVLDELGGFGGMFRLFAQGPMKDPVLVSGTDGVGTKLLVAEATGRYDGLGQDLVAMCANDVLCTGARPLFFLDYYATAGLDEERAVAVIASIAQACKDIGCALIGGEIAEMPGVYPEGGLDLAGFCVGVAEREALIDGNEVAAGHAILGLPSTGVHSNGLSLARKIVTEHLGGYAQKAPSGQTWGEVLCTPTALYERPVRCLLDEGVPVHALSHITGGGLTENLCRPFPSGLGADLVVGSWTVPALFGALAAAGGVHDDEMRRTFNLGIGLCVTLPADEAERALAVLAAQGHEAVRIGTVTPGAGVRYTDKNA